MKKKLISAILSASMLFSVSATLSGCGGGEYPVKVANVTIEKEPKNIAVLDPRVADIVSFMGYDVKIVGRSSDVNQEWLSVAPEFGTMYEPDIDKIAKSEADLVLVGSTLSQEDKNRLKSLGIDSVQLALPETPTQLKKSYETIGKILGGTLSGENKGKDAYSKLINNMNEIKSAVESYRASNVHDTVCYIGTFADQLQIITSGTIGDMILNSTGADNIAINIVDKHLDANVLRVANPDFIFYDTPETLAAIKADKVLSQLSAIKNNKVLQISTSEMTRYGNSMIETLNKMVSFMYPELSKGNTESTTLKNENATKGEEATKTDATKAQTTNPSDEKTTESKPTETTEPTTENTSVADKYKISLDGLSLKPEDEDKNVKAVQQRLFDLGYVDDKENITGYYGQITEKAVKDFQKKNGIKTTGTADNKTLVKLFDSSAK